MPILSIEDERRKEAKKKEMQRALTKTLERKDKIIFILKLLAKGNSTTEIRDLWMEEYGIPKEKPQVYYYWQGKAMEALKKQKENMAKYVVEQQVLRLENILKMALERNDYKAANSIIDTMNKTLGVYNIKQEVTIQPITHFSFGNDTPQETITAIHNAIGMDTGETDNGEQQ